MEAQNNLIKVVITGGPSGGKTTLIEALSKDFRGRVSVVGEAASILYRGGFPRRKHETARKHTQRAICFVQRELEDLVMAEGVLEAQTKPGPSHILVCDRGSLDSIAYWPGPAEDFFQNMGTSKEAELSRYQWVIHLDTADQDSFDTSNPVRLENYNEAIQLNNLIKEAWAGHPHRLVIEHSSDFIQKIAKAKKVIESILAGASYERLLMQMRSNSESISG